MRGYPFVQSGSGAAVSSTIYAPLSSAWAAATDYALNQLVLYSGTVYAVSTAHTSGGAFDATKFTAVSAPGAGLITPTTNLTLGTTETITAGGAASAVFEGTLDQASCALTFTGFTASRYSEIWVSIVGSSGKTATFTDTITWAGGFAPVFSTTGVTEFVIFSLDGTNLRGAHGQAVRTILWAPGNSTTTVSALSSPNFPVFNDARIVGGLARLVTAGTVQSTKVDVNINGTTAYGTTHTNQPTIAISATSSGNITLPDTTLITPGQYVSFDVDQFGTSAAGLSVALRVLEAA